MDLMRSAESIPEHIRFGRKRLACGIEATHVQHGEEPTGNRQAPRPTCFRLVRANCLVLEVSEIADALARVTEITLRNQPKGPDCD